MKINKPSYLTETDWKLLNDKYKNMHRVARKLKRHYPVQYLIGNVSFYGYEICVSKGVLIPRFETEYLVEKTIELIKKYNLQDSTVLDIGTGSGCISIALKKELPDLSITSIDKSRKALKIARKNIKNNKVDINLLNVSVFRYSPLNKYDVLICNPPYLKKGEKIDKSCKYEPKMSLFAKHDGLKFYDYIIPASKKYMKEKSILAFEIGYEQGSYLKKLAKKHYPNAKIKVEKDLSEKDRYLFIINE